MLDIIQTKYGNTAMGLLLPSSSRTSAPSTSTRSSGSSRRRPTTPAFERPRRPVRATQSATTNDETVNVRSHVHEPDLRPERHRDACRHRGSGREPEVQALQDDRRL